MRGLKNLTDVIFPFSCTSLSLYRCDTATFSASESKTALNGFLKDASLSPTLNLLTFVVHAISSFEMKTRGFEIVADVIVQFSGASSRLYRNKTAAFSASESKTILHGFLKDANLSPVTLVIHMWNFLSNWSVGRWKILADVIFTFSRASLRLSVNVTQPPVSVSES